ncbi:hypothetical protein V6N13_142679 [Hibiscus sabdariffa]|uniref:Uncharacterized protein n=1 Tax=Hibiscus sabdariffa TaxID=183260 RepID=A0ABR2FF91_9ROSI
MMLLGSLDPGILPTLVNPAALSSMMQAPGLNHGASDMQDSMVMHTAPTHGLSLLKPVVVSPTVCKKLLTTPKGLNGNATSDAKNLDAIKTVMKTTLLLNFVAADLDHVAPRRVSNSHRRRSLHPNDGNKVENIEVATLSHKRSRHEKHQPSSSTKRSRSETDLVDATKDTPMNLEMAVAAK